MAYPPTPVRQYSFTDHSTNTPTVPQPGDRLDSEIDRSNGSIAQTISYLGISLNTDGTLKSGSVGQTQLAPGLFDFIGDDAAAQVQPLVTQAQAYAGSANTSANDATTSANSAALSANDARGAANTADNAALDAGDRRDDAQVSANTAQTAATSATNSDNHAVGAANLAEDWADVSIEWAEHMPDTIPPNILAIAAVTGDHWSSRWWANRAKIEGEEALAELQRFYLGAFVSAPGTDNQGNALATGAMYFDLTLQAMYVWNGAGWQPLTTPSPAQTYRYIYVATAGQTVFAGADRAGHILVLGAGSAVFENGVLRTPTDDYSVSGNTVTFTTPCQAGDIVQVWADSAATVRLDWRTARLNTTAWVFDGVTRAFPLKDPANAALIMSAASDLILSRDGVWQQAEADYTVASSTLTFATAPPSDSRVFGIAIVPVPNVASPQPGVASIDTSSWVFNGTNVTFPILGAGAVALVPVAAENLLLSVNGVWQAAIRDYTVTGSTVTLLSPPEPGSRAFGVVGLPAFGA